MVSSRVVVASLAVQLWLQVASVRVQMEDVEDVDVAPAAEVSLVAEIESKPKDDDYWLEAGALERCRKARTGRFIKQVVGIPVGAVMAGPFMYASGWMGILVWGMSYSALEVAAGYTMYVAFTVTTVPTSMIKAQKTANRAVELLPTLLGANGRHPACCCNSSSFCALMGSTHTQFFQKQASCPKGWEHDATQCVSPELLAYERKTVSGCVCKEEEDGLPGCEGNKLDRGHAWCEVEETAYCGYRFSLLKKQRRQGARWDYCRFAEKGMLEDGSVLVNNSALSAFVPNVHKKGLIPRLSSANPWTLNTWVDRRTGVAIQRPSKLAPSHCFAGIPVETLGGCALKCLEEGAPNSKTMEGDQEEMRYPCTAFAYNRQTRICVRLPSFARDAEFTPRIKSPDAKGWQNFIIDQ